MRTSEQQERGPSLLSSIWRFRVWVLVAVLASGALGYAISVRQPRTYEAVGLLLLIDPVPEAMQTGDDDGISDRDVANEAIRVDSEPVARRAATRLGGLSAADVAATVSVTPLTNRDALELRAAAVVQGRAREVLDAVIVEYTSLLDEEAAQASNDALAQLQAQADSLRRTVDEATFELEVFRAAVEADISPTIVFNPERPDALAAAVQERVNQDVNYARVQARRDAAQTQLNAVTLAFANASVRAELTGSSVEIINPPTEATAPISPRPRRDAALAAALGLVLAAAVAWGRAETDQRIMHPSDAAELLDAPLLGFVPRSRRVGPSRSRPTAVAPLSRQSDAYHALVAALDAADVRGRRGARVLQITSAGKGDGKTRTALNIAIAAARDGRRVVLVDADLRRRSVTRLAKARDVPGLLDFQDAEVSVAERSIALPGEPDVLLVPAGVGGRRDQGHPAGFLRSRSMERAVRLLREEADLVILDSPPLAVSDTAAVTAHVDGLVVVVNWKTPVAVLRNLGSQIDQLGAQAVGFVLNRAHSRAGHPRYGHYRYRRQRRHRSGQPASEGSVVEGQPALAVTGDEQRGAGEVPVTPPHDDEGPTSRPEAATGAVAEVAEEHGAAPEEAPEPVEHPTPDEPVEHPTPDEPVEHPTPDEPVEHPTPDEPVEHPTPDDSWHAVPPYRAAH